MSLSLELSDLITQSLAALLVAPMTLRHRLILNFEGQAEGVQADQVIENVLETIREPVAA